jgi:NitT/TauT family transport system ATP-binding protein
MTTLGLRPADRANALVLSDITCTFGAGSADPYIAVRDASLVLGEGEFVSIVGPTGCGKSTLLNVAAGLLPPTAGAVWVLGEALRGLNRYAGYLFQADALLPWLSARGNVALGLELNGVSKGEAAEQAAAWLKRVGLAGHGGRYPHQLSGGMKKRVALAQILILGPKILLMDEPFSALDIQTRQLMENELLDIWSQDRTSVLFVTHDLEEAISLADRVIVLSSGPASTPVAQFTINIPRPRDVTEIVHTPLYLDTHRRIWETLKKEVLRSYELGKARERADDG